MLVLYGILSKNCKFFVAYVPIFWYYFGRWGNPFLRVDFNSYKRHIGNRRDVRMDRDTSSESEFLLADVDLLRACLLCGKTCSDVDKLLERPVGWARSVMRWWWTLPEEHGGMEDFNPYDSPDKIRNQRIGAVVK